MIILLHHIMALINILNTIALSILNHFIIHHTVSFVKSSHQKAPARGLEVPRNGSRAANGFLALKMEDLG